MQLIINILYLSFIAIAPYAVMRICMKTPILKKIGPILCCYALGFILSIFKPIDDELIKNESGVFLILAIPLFLFSSNISQLIKKAPKMLIAFVFSTLAVAIASLISSYFFQGIPFIPELSAGVAGVFTGGTLNFSALAIAFDMPANTFILINTVEALAGAVYFVILLKWGQSIISKSDAEEEQIPKRGLSFKNFLIALVYAVICVALSYGITVLIMGKMDLRILFLLLTIFGLLGSNIPSNKTNDAAYHAGDYFILVFCFAISQMINFKSLGEYGLEILGYIALTLFIINLIYAFLCKLFKIDKESATITHVASIFGPAFVVVYSNYLRKPKLILPGIAIGLMGYTVGTFLGIMLRDLIINIYNL